MVVKCTHMQKGKGPIRQYSLLWDCLISHRRGVYMRILVKMRFFAIRIPPNIRFPWVIYVAIYLVSCGPRLFFKQGISPFHRDTKRQRSHRHGLCTSTVSAKLIMKVAGCIA